MDVDYYHVLGISTSATDEEIKKAYKKRAKELHPDTPSGSEFAFKQLVDAYAVVGDPERRKDYDRKRNNSSSIFSSRFSKVATAASDTAKRVMNDIVDEGLFDTLDKILGRKKEPRDIEVHTTVTIEELYEGADKKIIFKRFEPCDVCKGKGAISKDDIKMCTDCYGFGHPNLASVFVKEECRKCKGTGRLIINKCHECSGKGECKYEREIVFPLPKDLSLGPKKDKLILPGQGEYGGNVLIDVDLKQHPYYEVEWPHLQIELPIKFYQAILGDRVEIDTLKGPAIFKINAGTEQGEVITLPGYGMRYTENNSDNFLYGDLVIKILISIPKRLSKEQRDLLESYKTVDKGLAKVKPKKK